MDIGFIGYGSLGEQIKSFLDEDNQYYNFYYFDDYLDDTAKNIFSFNSYLREEFNNLHFIVCLGYKHFGLKDKIVKCLLDNNKKLFTYIHKTSYISTTSIISPGSIIFPMSTIGNDCFLGYCCLVNNNVIISHNSRVGSLSYISPGVIINGMCSIGERCFVGSGTNVSNGVTIGDDSVIGLGSVITKDLESNSIGIGSPFKLKKIKLI